MSIDMTVAYESLKIGIFVLYEVETVCNVCNYQQEKYVQVTAAEI